MSQSTIFQSCRNIFLAVLGWTSTKQKIKCLAQGHNAVPLVTQTIDVSMSSLSLLTCCIYSLLSGTSFSHPTLSKNYRKIVYTLMRQLLHEWSDLGWHYYPKLKMVCLVWFFTSKFTMFQSCWDRLNQYWAGTQGYITVTQLKGILELAAFRSPV